MKPRRYQPLDQREYKRYLMALHKRHSWLTHHVVDPILSRLTVLHIQPPTPSQIATIAQGIYTRFRQEASWGHAFAEHLDEPVLTKIKNFTPRNVALVLRRALPH